MRKLLIFLGIMSVIATPVVAFEDSGEVHLEEVQQAKYELPKVEYKEKILY